MTNPRDVVAEDAVALGHVLAQAFHHDPFHRWVFPSERGWSRGSHRMFSAMLRCAIGRAVVLTTPGREAASLWRTPDRPHRSIAEELAFGWRVLPFVNVRVAVVSLGLARLAKFRPKGPHWYLEVIGTAPEHQGRGLATSLLTTILRRCDAEQLPAYLDASRQRNVDYYRRHGFEVLAEVQLPKGPVVCPMLRQPRS